MFGGESGHMEGHPHHWYQWLKEWIVPILVGLVAVVAGTIKICKRRGR